MNIILMYSIRSLAQNVVIGIAEGGSLFIMKGLLWISYGYFPWIPHGHYTYKIIFQQIYAHIQITNLCAQDNLKVSSCPLSKFRGNRMATFRDISFAN